MRGAAAAAVAALALLGCGDEREQFRDDVEELRERAEGELTLVQGKLQSLQLGSEGDARDLRALSAELAETYGEIAALEPPGEYVRAFTAHVRANERALRELERVARELEAGDESDMRRASERVVEALGASESARLRWLE